MIDAQQNRAAPQPLPCRHGPAHLFGTEGGDWTGDRRRRVPPDFLDAGLIRSIEGRLGSSEAGTDVWLPILEGTVCALGVAGVVLSETLPQIRDDADLRLGLGTASSGLTGLGCASLAGHFLWPAVAPDAVHNSYLWDGLTGLGGALIGGGLYLLISLLGGGQNPPMGSPRFPVDEYGP